MSVLPRQPRAADPEPTALDGPVGSPPAVGALPERIGPYAVIERLGQGGMGEVFLVRDHRFERQLALKRLTPYPSLPVDWQLDGSLGRESYIPFPGNASKIEPEVGVECASSVCSALCGGRPEPEERRAVPTAILRTSSP